jgi:hypothetical protein
MGPMRGAFQLSRARLLLPRPYSEPVRCEKRYSLATQAIPRLTLEDHSLRGVRTGVTMLSPQSC